MSARPFASGSSTRTASSRRSPSRERRSACSPSTAPTCTGRASSRTSRLPVAAGGRFDIGYMQPANGVRVAIEGTEVGARARPERCDRHRGELTPTSDFDPLDVRHAGADAVRCQLDVRPPLRADDHAQARLLRRHARAAVGDQRRHLPGRARVRRREGRPRRGHDHERLERHRTRCTCTVITLLVLSRDGQPSTGSPWWSDTLNVHTGESYVVAFRADNPGHLDGPLPQPHARRRRADDARRLRRRQHAVPRRRRARATRPE